MFCTGSTNKDLNTNENIINTNCYLNQKNLAQSKNFIDQKNSNTELLNLDTAKFLKNLFTSAYKKTSQVMLSSI